MITSDQDRAIEALSIELDGESLEVYTPAGFAAGTEDRAVRWGGGGVVLRADGQFTGWSKSPLDAWFSERAA